MQVSNLLLLISDQAFTSGDLPVPSWRSSMLGWSGETPPVTSCPLLHVLVLSLHCWLIPVGMWPLSQPHQGRVFMVVLWDVPELLTDCDTCVLQGNVYVKCPSIAAAVAAVNALHGRWFAGECTSWPELHLLIRYRSGQILLLLKLFLLFCSGKMITAAYVPLPTYHSLFPDSMTATQLLVPVRR